MHMKKVSTVELKTHLSKYLGMVKEGETLYVTSHRRPVAKISPAQGEDSVELIQPTLPMSCMKELKGIKPASKVDGVKILIADRRRR